VKPDSPPDEDYLRFFRADLHIHTVLSACAEIEMIPSLILRQARQKGVNLIAITDHNACHNVEAVLEAAKGSGIHVLPGMELQSREEVHLLCLFDRLESCKALQDTVFERLPPMTNKEDVFGPQYVVNAAGEWLWTEERLLAVSTDLTLEEVVSLVDRLGGMTIPAHVDRPSYSLLANLGLIPETLTFPALEVTPYFGRQGGCRQWPQLKDRCLILSGDAHRLQEIQNRTVFKMALPEIKEMVLAFQGQQGRQVVVEWPIEQG
jgi:3',5'-nucleoside bisphosphate phosphatase